MDEYEVKQLIKNSLRIFLKKKGNKLLVMLSWTGSSGMAETIDSDYVTLVEEE